MSRLSKRTLLVREMKFGYFNHRSTDLIGILL
jgi:hypothetical protein